MMPLQRAVRPLAALLLVALLSSCTIIENWVQRPDGASLTLVQEGVVFDAGGKQARGVIVIIIADELELPADTPCEIVEPGPADTVAECRLGDLEGQWLVEFTGINPDASASFRRPNLSNVFHILTARRAP